MVLYNPKTKTLFRRDDNFKVMTDHFTDDRYRQVTDWLVTEKMDGMSVILSTNDGFHGRSPRTQFQGKTLAFMEQAMHSVAYRFFQKDIENVDVYAELVGPQVQGNPHNLTELQLFVFDVRIGDYWLDWHNVKDVAEKAGLQTVEVKGRWTMPHIIADVKARKAHGDGYFEGYVARTDPYLYDNQGNRIVWKLKGTDFA